jgi:hypothetical protein
MLPRRQAVGANARKKAEFYRHAIATHTQKSKVHRQKGHAMPTLFRFLFIIATLAAMAYALLWAVVIFVEPRPREITTTVFPSDAAPKTP